MAEEERIAQVNAHLAEVNAQVFPEGLGLVYCAVAELVEQEINPHAMSKRMLDQLIENVKRDKALESIPLCVRVGETITIISGHHRVRAARAAGLTQVVVLLYESLSRARMLAKQLAHNSIVGTDDADLIRRVWSQIDDVSARFEAFIDPRIFDAVPEPVQFKPIDVDMDKRARAVLLLFLPTQKQDYDVAVEAILPKAQVDAVYLASREAYDGWKAALQRVREECEVFSLPTAVAEMARLAVEALALRQAQQTEQVEQAEREATPPET